MCPVGQWVLSGHITFHLGCFVPSRQKIARISQLPHRLSALDEASFAAISKFKFLTLALVICAEMLLSQPMRSAEAVTEAKPEASGFDLRRPEIAAFIARVVRKDGLPVDWVTGVLSAGVERPELTVAMKHPAETELAWWQYRARFVTAERIEAGLRYWQQHKEDLDAAASKYGVPAEYLVAILGVETNYGQITGGYREIDTLMTLAFNYPARAAAFRHELDQFLMLTYEMKRDPLTIRGSYGGALGAPQFLPSNYRKFAASRMIGGGIDLWSDWSAVYAAIANFFNERGWQKNASVVIGAIVADGAHPPVSDRLKLNQTLRSLRAKGVQVDTALPKGTRAMLIGLALQNGTEYRVAFKNFFVISRYNPSTNYTMAVFDLAEELRRAMTDPVGPKPDPASSTN